MHWTLRSLPWRHYLCTFRMELSCRVFLVSYPSNKQHRTVNPEPANSARFRSAKPSCGQGKQEKSSLKRQCIIHRTKEESVCGAEQMYVPCRSLCNCGYMVDTCQHLLSRMKKVTFLIWEKGEHSGACRMPLSGGRKHNGSSGQDSVNQPAVVA